MRDILIIKFKCAKMERESGIENCYKSRKMHGFFIF